METFELIIRIIFILAVCVLFYVIKFAGPAYLKEKGANLAKKEDIEELTRKVKDVETIFIKETEILKANLALENQLKVPYLIEERKEIVDFAKTLRSLFVHLISPSVINGIDDYDNDKLNIYRQKLHGFNMELLTQYGIFLLYIEEDLNIENQIQVVINHMVKEIFPSFDNLISQIKENNDLLNKQEITKSEEEYLLKQRFDIITTYHKDVNELILNSGEDWRKLLTLFKSYLYNKTKNTL